MNNNLTNKNHWSIKKMEIKVNHLDDNKKKTLRNRLLVSLFVFIYYILIIATSLIADNTGITKIVFKLETPMEVKIVSSVLYLFIIYFPFFMVLIEINKLIFDKNYYTLTVILFCGSIFFFLPNVSYISFEYLGLFDYPANTDPNLMKINELNKIRLFFGTILLSIILTAISVNIILAINKKNSFKNVITLNFLMFLVPYGFMSFGVIGLLQSWIVLLFVFFSVVFTDGLCYIFGLLFGKTKMAPVISPNKTWEGAIIGCIFAVVGLLVYAGLWKIDSSDSGFKMLSIFKSESDAVNWVWVLFISIALTVISVIGDFTFSYIKRKYEIKDYGVLLKSHGGFLDRVDSLVFASSSYTAIMFITSSMVDWGLFTNF